MNRVQSALSAVRIYQLESSRKRRKVGQCYTSFGRKVVIVSEYGIR